MITTSVVLGLFVAQFILGFCFSSCVGRLSKNRVGLSQLKMGEAEGLYDDFPTAKSIVDEMLAFGDKCQDMVLSQLRTLGVYICLVLIVPIVHFVIDVEIWNNVHIWVSLLFTVYVCWSFFYVNGINMWIRGLDLRLGNELQVAQIKASAEKIIRLASTPDLAKADETHPIWDDMFDLSDSSIHTDTMNITSEEPEE